MKKNLIIQGIVAFGLLLGTAFAAQAAETQPLADTSGSMVSAPLDESTTDAPAVSCDEDGKEDVHLALQLALLDKYT